MLAGLSEKEFWDMTLAEVERYLSVYAEKEKIRQRNQAAFDYTLAALIGSYITRALGGKHKIPSIDKMYPTLFDDEEIKQAEESHRIQIMSERFRQFANTHNSKLQGGEINSERNTNCSD